MLEEGSEEEDRADALETDDATSEAEPSEEDKNKKKKPSQKKVKVGEPAEESPVKKKKGWAYSYLLWFVVCVLSIVGEIVCGLL